MQRESIAERTLGDNNAEATCADSRSLAATELERALLCAAFPPSCNDVLISSSLPVLTLAASTTGAGVSVSGAPRSPSGNAVQDVHVHRELDRSGS